MKRFFARSGYEIDFHLDRRGEYRDGGPIYLSLTIRQFALRHVCDSESVEVLSPAAKENWEGYSDVPENLAERFSFIKEEMRAAWRKRGDG